MANQRLIDANELRNAMYHDAFEIDSVMQKWDSGCWIRYKLFEKNIDSVKTIDAVEVVRCKDCIHLFDGTHRANCCEVLMEKAKWIQEITVDDDFYCKDGKRKGV